MSTEFAIVPIAGQQCLSVHDNGDVVVPIRPLSDGFGLDWSAQYRRINRTEILAEGVAMTAIPSGHGGMQEALCLPVHLAFAWLVTIQLDRIPDPTIRASIKALQLESFDAMYDYWAKGSAHNPRFARSARSIDVRGALRLLAAVREERNPEVRVMLHRMLTRMGEEGGFEVPAVEALCAGTPMDARQAEMLSIFWERYDWLSNKLGEPTVNMHRDPARIAVNMPAFEKLCAHHRLPLPPLTQLRPALRTDPRFDKAATVNAHDGKTQQCWVFLRDNA